MADLGASEEQEQLLKEQRKRLQQQKGEEATQKQQLFQRRLSVLRRGRTGGGSGVTGKSLFQQISVPGQQDLGGTIGG